MMDAATLTVPVECIPLLGDMRAGDGGAHVQHGDVRTWYGHISFGVSLDGKGSRVEVAESQGMLLRLLARSLGEDGDGQLLLWCDRGRWCLQRFDERGKGPMRCIALCRSIRGDLDYLDALAVAVVWYARIARANDSDGSGPDSLDALEQYLKLPVLEVLP